MLRRNVITLAIIVLAACPGADANDKHHGHSHTTETVAPRPHPPYPAYSAYPPYPSYANDKRGVAVPDSALHTPSHSPKDMALNNGASTPKHPHAPFSEGPVSARSTPVDDVPAASKALSPAMRGVSAQAKFSRGESPPVTRFVIAPALTTLLLKIPLLLPYADFVYHKMTPPRAPPPKKELTRFSEPDFMSRTPYIQIPASAASKYLSCGAARLQRKQSQFSHNRSRRSPTSDRILSFLLPMGPATLRLTVIAAMSCVVGAAGGFLRVWCHRALGRFFTWQVAVRDDHELNMGRTHIPGSNFAESGLWDTTIGKTVALASFAYCTLVSISLIRMATKEDLVLKKQFGGKWDAWAKQTPLRLILKFDGIL
ncbi:hypothetical protein C8Q74DRAFT_1371236 [Fomes fomentarius]|nr:hypothetical protein C8Q74DRAFT_1371236 [Fomes fomentarius]